MLSWLNEFVVRNTYQLIIVASNQFIFLTAVLMFCIPLKNAHRPHFARRLCGMLLLSLVFILAAACLRTVENTVLSRLAITLLIYLIPLGVVFVCFDCTLEAGLKIWSSGIAASQIAAVLYGLLQRLLGVDHNVSMGLVPAELPFILDLLCFACVRLLMYYLLYRLAGRRLPESYDAQSRRIGILISLGALLVLTLTDSVSIQYQGDSQHLYLTCRGFTFVCAVIILLMHSSLELHTRANAEIRLMERILSEERKQYRQMKDNIDVINRMCHDLRHQMDDFSDRLTADEMQALQKAMAVYDRNIRTGCEALDVVLYLHQVTCQRENIRLTCLADGAALSFMRTRHIYNLFNNAISNAVEAVCKVADPARRVISVTVGQRDGAVSIEVTNYYQASVDLSLHTTKKDLLHHGFGTQSMKYIAEQYHGTMMMLAEDDVYTLHIVFPNPPSAPMQRMPG